MLTDPNAYIASRTRRVGDCIEWILTRTPFGYGVAQFGGNRWYAHRLAFACGVGAIPAGMCVLHRCDNPSCVNVEHLWLGTRGDNNRDRSAKGRTARVLAQAANCPNGHPYEAGPRQCGKSRFCRRCRICQRGRCRRYRAKLREKHSLAAS